MTQDDPGLICKKLEWPSGTTGCLLRIGASGSANCCGSVDRITGVGLQQLCLRGECAFIPLEVAQRRRYRRAPGCPTGSTFGERQHVTATDLMSEVKVLQEHKPAGAAVRRPPKRGPIRVTWKPRYPTARGYGHSQAHTLHLFFFARRAGAICGARAVSPRRHSSS